jgi:hypothetical protein
VDTLTESELAFEDFAKPENIPIQRIIFLKMFNSGDRIISWWHAVAQSISKLRSSG